MKNNFKHFIWVGSVLFPTLVMLNTILFWFVFDKGRDSFFFILAAAIVVSWVLILTLYYVWAIYFYNINRGWTDKDWDDHDSSVLVQDMPPPDKNPNSDETLGLPPGTVRGTIALSVLVGGMAMLVASLAMPGRLAQNEFLVDNFEYIKTAFLMVIAFYFGTKSLEFISRNQIIGRPVAGANGSATTTTTTNDPVANTSPAVAPVVGDISRGDKAEVGDFNDSTAQG